MLLLLLSLKIFVWQIVYDCAQNTSIHHLPWVSERRNRSQACWTGAPVKSPFLSVHLFSWQWNRARLLNSESALLGTQGYAGVRDQLSDWVSVLSIDTHTATPGPEAGVSCERVSYYSSNLNARSMYPVVSSRARSPRSVNFINSPMHYFCHRHLPLIVTSQARGLPGWKPLMEEVSFWLS